MSIEIGGIDGRMNEKKCRCGHEYEASSMNRAKRHTVME
jgi:hypothetical protein